MRIGVVVDNELDKDQRVLNEIKILKNLGHTVEVLCFGHSDDSFEGKIDGLYVTRFRKSLKWKNRFKLAMNILPIYEFAWSKAIKKWVKDRNIDVVHVHDLYMARTTHAAKVKYGIPVVLDLHENYPEAVVQYKYTQSGYKSILAQANWWKKKEGKYLRFADRWIVLSNYFKRSLVDRFNLNPESIFIYPNVPDLEIFKGKTYSPAFQKPGHFVIIYFGVIGERRGVYSLMRAMRDLRQKNLDVHLLLIGPVDKAERKTFFKTIGNPLYKSSVHYVSWVNMEDLGNYMVISDLGASPILKNEQHDSGVANKVFQYMYFGLPVLATNSIAQKELLEEANAGFIYEDGHINQMIDLIEFAYNNPDVVKKMGDRGEALISSAYNIKSFGNVFEKLYSNQLVHIRS